MTKLTTRWEVRARTRTSMPKDLELVPSIRGRLRRALPSIKKLLEGIVELSPTEKRNTVYLLYSLEYEDGFDEYFFAYITWRMDTSKHITNYDEEAYFSTSNRGGREDFLREKASLESTLGFIAMDDPSYFYLQKAAENYRVKSPELLAEGIMLL